MLICEKVNPLYFIVCGYILLLYISTNLPYLKSLNSMYSFYPVIVGKNLIFQITHVCKSMKKEFDDRYKAYVT